MTLFLIRLGKFHRSIVPSESERFPPPVPHPAFGHPLPRGEGTGQSGVDIRPAITAGLSWLIRRVEDGSFREASPIGFYFAKLWYFEALYPLIFTVAALRKAAAIANQSD